MKNDSEMVLKTIETTRKQIKGTDLLLPTFFVGTPENVAIVGAGFTDESEKDATAQIIRTMAKKMEAEFVLFVSEVYTISDQAAALDFQNNRDKYKQVKDHPKAEEVVLFQLETISGHWMGIAKIGDKREMGEVTWIKPDHSEGRFTNFLPKPVVH